MELKKLSALMLMLSMTANFLSLILIFPVHAQLPLPPGVPRGDVVVVRQHDHLVDAYQFNYMVPGRAGKGEGYHQVCVAYLWYANTTTGELISWLAEGVSYSEDFKTCKIFTRRGAHWNDGVPFTAHDVIFTIKTALQTSEWVTHATAVVWIEDAYAENDYTAVIKLKKPNPRFHYLFASIIWGTSWEILPKHIWEGKDPVNFNNYPPLSIGPYNLVSVDPGGTWRLYEREEDWWAYKLWGLKPSPKYVLWLHPGPEEKVALMMARHEMDCGLITAAEVAEIAIKGGAPYIISYQKEPPYAWPYDSCIKTVTFNLLRYPFNITEVRKALAFAINYSNLAYAFTGWDGSKPIPMALPVVRTPVADEIYYKPLENELVKLGLDNKTWFWKYDPAWSENTLKSHGFTKDENGKWHLPSGELWKIEILGPPAWADISRLSFLIAEEWKKFGIEAEAVPVAGTVWSTRVSKGDFDVVPAWPPCTMLTDLTPHIQGWHSKYFNPLAPGWGWAAYQFPKRAELEAIIDEMEMTPPTEKEKLIDLGRRALLIWAEELPYPCYFSIPFYTLMDTYAWYGWPTYPDNYYMDPVFWWGQFLFILLKLYPSGRAPTRDALPHPGWTPIEYSGVWIIGDVPAFTGADGLSYGPYRMGDYARMPKSDADRLIAQGLASSTPPIAPGISESLNRLLNDTSALRRDITSLGGGLSDISTGISTLRDEIAALRRELSAISTVSYAVIVVVIITLVATVALALRKPK